VIANAPEALLQAFRHRTPVCKHAAGCASAKNAS